MSGYPRGVQRVSPAEFNAFPLGHYVVGRTWAYFCAHEDLAGFLMWGHFSRADGDEVAAIAPSTTGPPMTSHVALIDARSVESVDQGAFDILREYLTNNYERISRTVRKFAIVRPEGLYATVALGVFEVLPRPFDVDSFTDPEDALAWLERSEDLPLLAELDAIAREAGAPSLVARLRILLDARVHEIAIEDASKALGLSVRGLQRRLQAESTSFLAQLNDARVRAAQRLMATTDASLSQVALQVGYPSQAQLSVIFRRITGETPSGWRKRVRGN